MFVITDKKSPGPHKGHIAVLDGIRGLAILLVMIRHFTLGMRSESAFDAWFKSAASIGWSGVDLFFVLSGFLITGLLLDSKQEKDYFKNFFARRALRIFPLYYAVLVGIFVVLPLTPIVSLPDFTTLEKNQGWYWAYASNILNAVEGPSATPLMTDHFWSLAVEEQFYLLWPAVVLLLSGKNLLRLCLILVGCGVAFRFWMFAIDPESSATYVLLPSRVDALSIGALIALIARQGNFKTAQQAALWILPICLSVLMVVFLWNQGLDRTLPFVQTVGFTLVGLAFGSLLVLAITASRGTPLNVLLESRFLRSLGRYSYAIYIFHWPLTAAALVLIGGWENIPVIGGSRVYGQIGFAAALTCVSTLVAWLSWHLFEIHFLKLKKHFVTRSSLADAPDPPATSGRRLESSPA